MAYLYVLFGKQGIVKKISLNASMLISMYKVDFSCLYFVDSD